MEWKRGVAFVSLMSLVGEYCMVLVISEVIDGRSSILKIIDVTSLNDRSHIFVSWCWLKDRHSISEMSPGKVVGLNRSW